MMGVLKAIPTLTRMHEMTERMPERSTMMTKEVGTRTHLSATTPAGMKKIKKGMTRTMMYADTPVADPPAKFSMTCRVAT